ncbi:hypothetical protein KKD52_12270, partial [Myxococcota bacterium]|nr:hypothetical protein [Myxococcota bacterium]MBU1511129.1 hypothetical protein [Myxococcota bacterium]
ATRLADHSPLMVISGSSLMRFYQYNGTELSLVWSTGSSQLVESMAFTGTDLLIKHVGNLQLYRIDLAAHTKTADGDLLPTGASYFTLLPSRLRMVLGVGGGLKVKAYQQVGGHWTGWPTFLQVQ